MGIGLFRLVLALAVVVTHTYTLWGFTLGNPVVAVRIFFIISGFYMTLILKEKYKDNKSFWLNRVLKIYPIYWVILILTVASCIGAYTLRGNWGEMKYLVEVMPNLSLKNIILMTVSQFIIFGRSLVMFGSFSNLSGVYFLLIPQAWTLVLELWFYLLAPFIVTKKWWIIVLVMIMSLFSRWIVTMSGLKGDLWEYRFFPSELIYFLMGSISYWIYRLVQSAKCKVHSFSLVFLFVAVGLFWSFNYWLGNLAGGEWILYFLIMGIVPLLFIGSKDSRIDRQLGDLSYPVYITHILVNNVVYPLLFVPFQIDRNWQTPTVMLLSIVLSLLINHFIQRPVEVVRQKGVR
ncbi:acyltransferase [Candidatus Shapirobacteria bacterium]|nr:acyltransferase [Candidatus Shapirobacteria bacterium]